MLKRWLIVYQKFYRYAIPVHVVRRLARDGRARRDLLANFVCVAYMHTFVRVRARLS